MGQISFDIVPEKSIKKFYEVVKKLDKGQDGTEVELVKSLDRNNKQLYAMKRVKISGRTEKKIPFEANCQ